MKNDSYIIIKGFSIYNEIGNMTYIFKAGTKCKLHMTKRIMFLKESVKVDIYLHSNNKKNITNTITNENSPYNFQIPMEYSDCFKSELKCMLDILIN